MRYRRAPRVAWWTVVCAGLGLPGICGCSMLNGFLDPTKLGQFPSEFTEQGIRRALTAREGPPGLANAEEPDAADLVPIYDEYRIAAGDVLSVTVYGLTVPGAPEQFQLEVTATGNLRVPQLGSIQVAGMTEQEIEEELKSRFREARLLPDPDVRVYAGLRRGRTFTVRGSVGQPGQYPIADPDTRLLDVIGAVGDIGPNVNTLYIIRRAERSPMESDAGAPPQAGEDLVLPPPPPEGDTGPSFYATAAYGVVQPPAEGQATRPTEADIDELGEVIAPEGARDAAQAAEDDEMPEPEPLIFDPETGELVEPQKAEPGDVPVEALPRDRVEKIIEDEFDWEDVPELQLQQRVIEIDVRSLLAGDPRYNVVMRNKDVVNVPVDTGVYYLMGEVARPGVYAFGGREITLQRAIASAGGLGPFAWPRRCEIIRHEPGTDKQLTIPVNLDAIFAGLEKDVFLRNDDIVNVGTHFVSPFLFVIRNSFRFTYGFGFVYDRNFADQDAVQPRINPETLAIQERQQRGLPF